MGQKSKAAYEARARRNDLNRKIQTRRGRIEVLRLEIAAMEAERDTLNRKLPPLDKAAFDEQFGHL